jgi:predicted Zn finger-like uncharacterized protein
MSLITRCPACGTLFKVVADQLKMSQGWVRCGQCSEVFDAQAYMAGAASGSSAPAPLQAEHAIAAKEALVPKAPIGQHPDGVGKDVTFAAAAPPAALGTATNPATFQIQMLGEEGDSAADPFAVSSMPPALYSDFSDSNWINTVNPPAPQNRADPVDSGVPSSMGANFSAEELAAVGAEQPPSIVRPTARPSLLPDGAAGAGEEQPSFVRQAQRAQRWRSPWVRSLLLLVSLAMLVTLGIQVALQERDRIAVLEPSARPWLKDLCAIAGCTVGPLKQIEAVVVEASSFNKLRAEGKFELYKLSLNLKNSGSLPVAVPHIELSLNDAQDQPVLRRVLNPADLGSAQSVLAPTAELTGNTTIQVDSTQLAGARVAGYRVWAFYP